MTAMIRIRNSQLLNAAPPMMAKATNRITSNQSSSNATHLLIVGLSFRLVPVAGIDVFARVPGATPGSCLGQAATDHVEHRGRRREDPKQSRVDRVIRRRRDPEPHEQKHVDEELTRQEKRLRL